MKFLHIADVHLGVKPEIGTARSSSQRAREIWAGLERIKTICDEEETDLLLIAGDLFHRQPLLKELKEVDAILGSLERTQVVLCAGNHDYLKKDSYYRTYSWSENIHMILKEELECVELPEIKTAIYGYSYHDREMYRCPFAGRKAEQRQKHEILMIHGGDEKHVPFKKEEVLSLDYDYIALGHIHKPGVLIPNQMAYAGALEPIDKNDVGLHGYISGEITKEGTKIRFVPCAAREYVHLSVTLEESMSSYEIRRLIGRAMEKRGMHHIYKLILSGKRSPEMLFDPAGMDAYGNVIEVVDHTQLAYDYQKLKNQNKGNLLGKLIEEMEKYPPDSLDYQALCRGVQALMETRRG